jgi:hypothetical protein
MKEEGEGEKMKPLDPCDVCPCRDAGVSASVMIYTARYPQNVPLLATKGHIGPANLDIHRRQKGDP